MGIGGYSDKKGTREKIFVGTLLEHCWHNRVRQRQIANVHIFPSRSHTFLPGSFALVRSLVSTLESPLIVGVPAHIRTHKNRTCLLGSQQTNEQIKKKKKNTAMSFAPFLFEC